MILLPGVNRIINTCKNTVICAKVVCLFLQTNTKYILEARDFKSGFPTVEHVQIFSTGQTMLLSPVSCPLVCHSRHHIKGGGGDEEGGKSRLIPSHHPHHQSD